MNDAAAPGHWVDVTLPLLELARRRIRGLVRFVEKSRRTIVYSDFADELGEGTVVDLPGVTPGTNWERFRAKPAPTSATTRTTWRCSGCAATYSSPRRTWPPWRRCCWSQVPAPRTTSPRPGRKRTASASSSAPWSAWTARPQTAAFDRYLSDATFTANQLRFIQLIVEHLTANGVMEVARLYESPFTDNAPQGPDMIFTEDQVDDLVAILGQVRDRALPDLTVA